MFRTFPRNPCCSARRARHRLWQTICQSPNWNRSESSNSRRPFITDGRYFRSVVGKVSIAIPTVDRSIGSGSKSCPWPDTRRVHIDDWRPADATGPQQLTSTLQLCCDVMEDKQVPNRPRHRVSRATRSQIAGLANRSLQNLKLPSQNLFTKPFFNFTEYWWINQRKKAV